MQYAPPCGRSICNTRPVSLLAGVLFFGEIMDQQSKKTFGQRLSAFFSGSDIDMCHGPVAGKLFLYALPLMLSGILQLCFNAADTIVVGRFESGDALAAVGSTGSLINLIINLFLGLSVGISVNVAHAWGAKNDENVRRIVHTAMVTALIGGIFVGMVGFFGCRTFLSWMGTPDNIIGLSTLYMKIYFLGMPACMVYNFGAAILRSSGDTQHPMLFLLIAGVVNVILNLITVIFFHMGVAGVAIATVASQVVSAALVVLFLMRQNNCCRLVLRELRIYPQNLLAILRIGIPAGLQASVFSISNVLIQSSINSFGSIAMEGNTAAGNLEGFIYISMNSFYHASLTFIGQNVGARQYHRIRRILLTCILLVSAVGITIGWAMYLFRMPLLSIYETGSEGMLAYGAERMGIIATTYFFCGIMEVFTGALRGLGASLIPMLISLVGACGSRVVWIYTVFAAHRTLPTLYLSWPMSWVLTVCMQIVAFILLYRSFLKKHRGEAPLEDATAAVQN